MLLQGLMHSMVEALVLFSEIESLVLDKRYDSETAGTIVHITTTTLAMFMMLEFSASS